ncbi:LpqN/LpqT family lipoprotein [Mycobacterium sp. 852002-10029_SCH5224772]|uniref:LpqN/LpqT family lipoprotein n=1 Tax=Mycobacterium sp. 852002-10029_SCH5224772 TaxID=1834083 RepID=UPI0007FF0965|nr:LpqN/LpqT family lipoprotein [Mycobacterium sp. 852002-10029_SCH5224772]OBE93917.1 hypothetical protein A5775_12810 [Mycobacterium sp. 852002-10029_SCH5224772]
MIDIVPVHRALLGGMVAGLMGLAVVAGGTASADPLPPAPAPVPVVPAQAPQNLGPELVPPSRYLAAPQAAIPVAPPATAGTPRASAPAAAAPATPPAPAPVPATSGTIREFLQSKGVKLEAQKPQSFKALDITLPLPARWTQVPDPNVPDAFAVIADRRGSSIYSSNAQVVVYKLVGDFDPKEAITHGYVDSQKLLAWQPTNASMVDFGGFPSSIIEGTYRDGDMTLNTSRRHVIATSGPDKYLVSLAVTTDRAVSVADAPATDAIINGFRVTAPGAAAPAPPQSPAASPVGRPAQPPAVAPAAPAPAVAPAAPAPAVAPAPATAPVAPVAPAPATAPIAPAPATAPLVPLAQTAPAAPVAPARLPAPTSLPNQQHTPSLLAMVPGLPPLPNFSFLQH